MILRCDPKNDHLTTDTYEMSILIQACVWKINRCPWTNAIECLNSQKKERKKKDGLVFVLLFCGETTIEHNYPLSTYWERQAWQPKPKLTSLSGADFNLIYKFSQHVYLFWSPPNVFRQLDGFRDHRRYNLAEPCIASGPMLRVLFVVSMAFLLLY